MLEGKNISVSFGEYTVLDNISIELSRGDRVALLGPSGAGKSTLLRILSGIQIPNSGEISLDGVQPTYENRESKTSFVRKWVWPRVTLVFQDLQLFPNLTGYENCSDNLQNENLSPSSELIELASSLGVLNCMNKIPKKMSQGEQQRVAIIRALAKHPEFLLMDEPTSAIDPIVKNQLVDLLVKRSDINNMGLLVATHDWEFANRFATRFIVVRNGSLSAFSTITEATNIMSGIG